MARPEWCDVAKEKQWRRSGLTGRDFCAQNSLSEPCFYFWKRQIAQRDQEKQATAKSATTSTALPTFVPVKLDAVVSSETALEIVTGNGRLVRVRAGFDAAVLRRLLTVLEKRSY